MIPPMAYPDATFLDYAAAVKKRVGVPVIAVGRLGDPKHAEEAVGSGKADFVALGRTLIADPDWVAKLARGEPARRCLACNTCVNEMRGGAQLRCVVNGAAGRERSFESARPPANERIAVIGAGPAGLTYASLVAERKCGDGVRARRASRRCVPLCRQGAAVPGRRRQPGIVRPLCAQPRSGVRGEGRDLPLRRRRRALRRNCCGRSTGS